MIGAAIELSEPAEDAIVSASRLRKLPPGTRDRSSPPPPANPEVFTIEEFCAWARISRTQTFNEIWAKRLIARRVGSKSLTRSTPRGRGSMPSRLIGSPRNETGKATGSA
jgi:hypothetical protein